MPTLKERIDDVFRATGQVVFEDWFDNLRTTLDLMAFYGAVTYDGYINEDLIPIEDEEILIGLPDRRLRGIYSEYEDISGEARINVLKANDIIALDIESDTITVGIAKVNNLDVDDLDSEYGTISNLSSNKAKILDLQSDEIYVSDTINTKELIVDEIEGELGYFSDNLFVQGKRVIKDEDPLYIASFFDKAVSQITESIIDALEDLNIPPKATLIGKVVGYDAPPMADVLPTDALVEFDGIVRIKMVSDYDVFAYLKWTPYGEPYPIVGLINGGNVVKSNVITEMETTVSKNDKVNVKVFPGAKISVFVYNMNIN